MKLVILLCFADVIMSSTESNQNHDQPCPFVSEVGLNIGCIQNLSNFTEGYDEINDFFKTNVVNRPSTWFNVGINSDGSRVTVNLTPNARDQMTLLSHFNTTCEVSLVNLKRIPMHCYVQSGPKTFKFNASAKTALLSPEKWSVELANSLEAPVAIKAIVHMGGRPLPTVIYWPTILKSSYPTKPPSRLSPNLIYVFLYHYGDVTEVFLHWVIVGCPQWNALPLSYEIECFILVKEELLTRKELSCMVTLMNTDNMTLSNEFETDCWFILSNKAVQSKRAYIEWHKQWTKFYISTNGTPEVICKVRAHNSIGPGPWSSISRGIRDILHIVHGIETRRDDKFTFNQYSFDPDPSLELEKVTSNVESIIGFHYNQSKLLKVQDNLLPVGCYDWIGDRWYVGVDINHQYNLAYVVDEKNGLQLIKPLWGEPKHMLCLPRQARVVWTEKTGSRVDLKVYHIRYSSENLDSFPSEQCLCPSWIDGNRVASSAIAEDLSNLNDDDARILVITTSGIWSTSLDNCSCHQILNFADNHQPNFLERRYDNFFSFNNNPLIRFSLNSNVIDSFAMYTYIRKDDVIVLSLIVLHKQDRHLVKMTIYGNQTYSRSLPDFPILERLSQEQLDLEPAFASHKIFLQSTEHPVKVISQRVVQPAPPAECNFPEIFVEHQILPNYMVSVKITALWSDSYICKRFSRPKLVYEIRYGFAAKNSSFTKCDWINLKDLRQDISDPSPSDNYETVIQLKKEQHYIFMVTIEPFLGRYRDLWFKTEKAKCGILPVFSKFKVSSEMYMLYVLATILIVVLLMVSIVSHLMYKRKWYIYLRISHLSASQVIYKEEEILGSGNFADVYKATIRSGRRHTFCSHSLNQPDVVAAVKMLKLSADQKAKSSFLEEAILISELDHCNIVKPIGICLDSRPIMLAMEFMDGGSLKSYLQRPETQVVIGQQELFKIIADVAQACSYLEKRGIVHRDLSAKNLLVQMKNNKPANVKIGDFGLAKDVRSMQDRLYKTDSPILPVAFTAPEGFSGIFSSKSDVWSFGVIVWEVFSWGATPFGKCLLSTVHDCDVKEFQTAEEIQDFVCVKQQALNNLPKPCLANFPDTIQTIMNSCWFYDASKRPSFEVILFDLTKGRTVTSVANLYINTGNEVNSPIVDRLPEFYDGIYKEGRSSKNYLELRKMKKENGAM